MFSPHATTPLPLSETLTRVIMIACSSIRNFALASVIDGGIRRRELVGEKRGSGNPCGVVDRAVSLELHRDVVRAIVDESLSTETDPGESLSHGVAELIMGNVETLLYLGGASCPCTPTLIAVTHFLDTPTATHRFDEAVLTVEVMIMALAMYDPAGVHTRFRLPTDESDNDSVSLYDMLEAGDTDSFEEVRQLESRALRLTASLVCTGRWCAVLVRRVMSHLQLASTVHRMACLGRVDVQLTGQIASGTAFLLFPRWTPISNALFSDDFRNAARAFLSSVSVSNLRNKLPSIGVDVAQAILGMLTPRCFPFAEPIPPLIAIDDSDSDSY